MSTDAGMEWNELTRVWKSRSGAISIEDLQRHLRRTRMKLLAVLSGEVLACVIGLTTAVCLALFTRLHFVGWGVAAGIVIITAITIHWQWSTRQQDVTDALHALTSAIGREERMLDVLATTRVVLLATLAAVVVYLSTELQNLTSEARPALLPLILSGLYLVASLAGCAVLARRARRRAVVFDRVRKQLAQISHPNDDANSNTEGSR